MAGGSTHRRRPPSHIGGRTEVPTVFEKRHGLGNLSGNVLEFVVTKIHVSFADTTAIDPVLRNECFDVVGETG